MKETFPVSVVITCFNYGKYLKSSIDSVLEQTVPVEEIIVVDDGSTDNTQSILSDYRTNEKIRFVYQKNRGQAKAKNTGLQLARGEFVAFLDADDIWAPRKIEKQIKLFKNPKVGVVYTRQKFINQKGEIISKGPRRLRVYRGNVRRQVLKDNFVPFSSAMVRKQILDESGYFNEKLAMSIDWELWLRLSLLAEFDYVDEDLLLYRVGHPGQMSKDLATREKCADMVFEDFLRAFGASVPRREVKDAKVYTYNNRGYYYRLTDIARAMNYYRKSVMEKPLQVKAYKGLILTPMAYYWKKAVG